MIYKNKKAQVSDTITLVVATLIIIVVLFISLAFTTSLSKQNKISITDKQKDFLATKSITGFLRDYSDDVGLLGDGNTGTKDGSQKLLEILPVSVENSKGFSGTEDQLLQAGAKAPSGIIGYYEWKFEKGTIGELSEESPINFWASSGNIEFAFWARCYSGGCN